MTDDEIIAAYDSQIGAGAGYHRAGLRAVERAARAAAFREAANMASDAGMSKLAETLRARAEGDGEGGR